MSARRFWLSALAVLTTIVGTNALADVFLAGEFRISTGDSEGTYVLFASLPPAAVASTDIEWPAGCTQTRVLQQSVGNQVQMVFEARCERPLGESDVIVTPWRLDGARVQTDLRGAPVAATLSRSDGGMIVPVIFGPRADRPPSALVPEFLWQGMVHIWLGWDHLAFVLCLCMLSCGYPLLGLITAFTLGHSLSLGLAFFDVVRLPIVPVEAVIALSIVLLARQALLARGDEIGAMKRPLIVATGFGLVHGLGFASALGELGVSHGERWYALVFFNVGVEVGQVAFIALVLAALAMTRLVSFENAARAGSLYVAGGVGFFWTMQRIADFPWG